MVRRRPMIGLPRTHTPEVLVPDGRTTAKTVLVVDDDEAVRASVTRTLLGAGYAVVPAADGQEALERLRNAPPPALILLDLDLPIMSGREFRLLQLADPALASIPVVVLSVAGEMAAKSDRLGDVGYLQKPVGEPELLAAVERFAVQRKPVVLIVEDEPAVRQMLGVALRHFGFEVHQAGNYERAMDLYWRHRDAIDVVLLDVQMPGLDGPHTLVALQGLNPDVQAVFMSGNTGSYTAADLKDLGAAHILTKPFKLADLTRELWKVASGR